MYFLRLVLVAHFTTILHATQQEIPSYGNYRMLSAFIDQYLPENDNPTINENFAVIAQGTHEGLLPVECGLMLNVTGPSPQEQVACTDPAVEVIVRQMHTSPEYGFDLFVTLK